jgi:hypothetical protein
MYGRFLSAVLNLKLLSGSVLLLARGASFEMAQQLWCHDR